MKETSLRNQKNPYHQLAPIHSPAATTPLFGFHHNRLHLAGRLYSHPSTMVDSTAIPWKTTMTMENQPLEDVSPIENGDLPLPC